MKIMRMATALLLGFVLLATAAAAEPEQPSVHFTAAGDYGVSAGTSGAVMAAIGAADPDAHFALGDLSYAITGEEETFCDFVKQRVGDGFPFELVAGNHESNGRNGNINDFSACLPNQLPGLVGTYGRQYYVDVPRDNPLVRFVMISPGLQFLDGSWWGYQANTARYAWTKAAVDGARAAGIPWVVAGMHIPCLNAGSYNCDGIGADLTNMFLQEKVDLVLTAHQHSYQRSHQIALGAGCPSIVTTTYEPACVADTDGTFEAGAGTVFATIGTGGTTQHELDPADPRRPYFAAIEAANQNLTYGFGDFEATPDRLSGRFVAVAGGDFTDSFVINRHNDGDGGDNGDGGDDGNGGDNGDGGDDGNPPAVNQPPISSFTTAVDGLGVAVDGSTSSDPDGTIQSWAWEFGDGATGSGAQATHEYAAAGTYTVALTVTDDGGATARTTHGVEVTAPDEPPGPTVLASDDFSRSVAAGWGRTAPGGEWVGGRTGGVASVSDGVGRINMLTPGAAVNLFLRDTVTDRGDVRVDFTTDKVVAGSGASVNASVYARQVGNDDYRVQIRIAPNGQVQGRMYSKIGSTQTQLGSTVTLPGLTYRQGDVLSFRAQAIGTSPTTLRYKVWRQGSTEPAAWADTATNTAAALQQPGNVAVAGWLTAGATNAPVQLQFDNLVLSQTETP